MKISSNITRQIEMFLSGNMTPAEAIVFEAKLLLDPVLKMNTRYQKKVYDLVRYHGRRKMKVRMERIHDQVFTDPAKKEWQKEITTLFNKLK